MLNGEPAGARTRDTLIKSQVLYQLSYGLIIFSLEKLNDYVKAVFDIHFKELKYQNYPPHMYIYKA